MPRRPKNEAIDQICKQWAIVRRQLVGVDDPQQAKEYVGALKCTLAQRRDLHSGARSGKVDIHWPEVYTGESAMVNQAFHAMRPELRIVMDLHYVARAPAQNKAEFLAMSMDTYWRAVRDVRGFVEGWLARGDVAA